MGCKPGKATERCSYTALVEAFPVSATELCPRCGLCQDTNIAFSKAASKEACWGSPPLSHHSLQSSNGAVLEFNQNKRLEPLRAGTMPVLLGLHGAWLLQ